MSGAPKRNLEEIETKRPESSEPTALAGAGTGIAMGRSMSPMGALPFAVREGLDVDAESLPTPVATPASELSHEDRLLKLEREMRAIEVENSQYRTATAIFFKYEEVNHKDLYIANLEKDHILERDKARQLAPYYHAVKTVLADYFDTGRGIRAQLMATIERTSAETLVSKMKSLAVYGLTLAPVPFAAGVATIVSDAIEAVIAMKWERRFNNLLALIPPEDEINHTKIIDKVARTLTLALEDDIIAYGNELIKSDRRAILEACKVYIRGLKGKPQALEYFKKFGDDYSQLGCMHALFLLHVGMAEVLTPAVFRSDAIPVLFNNKFKIAKMAEVRDELLQKNPLPKLPAGVEKPAFTAEQQAEINAFEQDFKELRIAGFDRRGCCDGSSCIIM